MNPQHSVPFMVDGEVKLNESRAIALYIVNKFEKPFLYLGNGYV